MDFQGAVLEANLAVGVEENLNGIRLTRHNRMQWKTRLSARAGYFYFLNYQGDIAGIGKGVNVLQRWTRIGALELKHVVIKLHLSKLAEANC